MRKLLIFLLLPLFLFISCNDDADYEDLFSEKRYQDVITKAEEMLASTLDEEALYYKARSHYYLNENEEASSSALLFSLVFDDNSEYYHHALRIVLNTRDDEYAIKAARKLIDDDKITKNNRIRYYQVLVKNGINEEADEVYSTLLGLLNEKEMLYLMLSCMPDSTKIITALENYYAEYGLDDYMISSLETLIPVFIKRSDISIAYALISNLSSKIDTPELLLTLGDFFYAAKERNTAFYYWSLAEEDYPLQAGLRMRDY